MITKEKIASYNWPYIAIGIILVVAIIASIVLSIITYGKIVSDENTINTHQDRLVALESQLKATGTELDSLSAQVNDAEGQVASVSYQQVTGIATLQDELVTATDQISSLTNQIYSVVLQIANLQTEVSYDSSAISTIQTQLSSITSQLSALSTTTVSLQGSLVSLENTVGSLVNQVNALMTGPTSPIILFLSQPISQAFGTQTLLYTFTSPHNGYVNISGTSSSVTGYIMVTNNTTGTPNYYPFGTGTTINAVVNAGYSYSISFGNSDAFGTITATLSVIYYY